MDSLPFPETGEESFYDTGGPDTIAAAEKQMEEEQAGEKGYSMDDIWKDIALAEENYIKPVQDTCLPLASPSLEYCLDSLWRVDEEESKMLLPTCDQCFPFYGYGGASITG